MEIDVKKNDFFKNPYQWIKLKGRYIPKTLDSVDKIKGVDIRKNDFFKRSYRYIQKTLSSVDKIKGVDSIKTLLKDIEIKFSKMSTIGEEVLIPTHRLSIVAVNCVDFLDAVEKYMIHIDEYFQIVQEKERRLNFASNKPLRGLKVKPSIVRDEKLLSALEKNVQEWYNKLLVSLKER